MQAFRDAIEAGDLDSVMTLMAEDVEFRSPVVFAPYRGRDALRVILGAVLEVFADFRYTCEYGAPDSDDHALRFRAKVGEREVEGTDFLHTGPDGLIDEFVVMVRPMSGMHALAEAMRNRLGGGPSA